MGLYRLTWMPWGRPQREEDTPLVAETAVNWQRVKDFRWSCNCINDSDSQLREKETSIVNVYT
jgi:hypothetical protein